MVQVTADTGLIVCLGGFLLSSFFLTVSYKYTFAFDRPVTTATQVCFSLGLSFLAVGRFVASTSRPPSPTAKNSTGAANQYELSSQCSTLPAVDARSSPSTSQHFWWKIGGLLGFLGVRIELFRRATLHNECAPAGYAYAIPLVIAVYELLRSHAPGSQAGYTGLQPFHNLSSNIALSTCRRSLYSLSHSRWRGVLGAFLVSAGGYAASSLSYGSQSSYICPIVLNESTHMQIVKLGNLILDSAILISLAEVFEEPRRKRTYISLGIGLVVLAATWTIFGHYVNNSRPEHSAVSLLDTKYLRSALGQGLLCVVFILSGWHILPYFEIVGLSILGGFVFVFVSTRSTLFWEDIPLLYVSHLHASLPIVFSTLGAVWFLASKVLTAEETKPVHRANVVLQGLFIVCSAISIASILTKDGSHQTHPIDSLIYGGKIHYDNYMSQASLSKTLADAVRGYRRRYQQHPPPGFDKWYEFATNRSSVIIDEFDQIHENLLPFRAVQPSQIREMTHKLATNPFNDLGAISIRSGQVKVQENVKPTHAWMVTGAAHMIETFAEHLPDMDIVLNLNDEPRVAVPWEKLMQLRRTSRSWEVVPNDDLLNWWPADRHLGWTSIQPDDPISEDIFTDGAWQGVLDSYVSAVCPPSSPVRTRRVWNRRDLCLSCVAPHTVGQFPVGFHQATEICHQPDLGFLHGLLISPASFKVSQELVPVFSQSALSGFSDILYPSPWNYMDKITHSPSEEHPDSEYPEKENSLYWIGSTSEGYSRFNEWKGMPRQRFSHLVNNNTQGRVSVLLPAESGRYEYQSMGGDAPARDLNLQANVHIATPITRCGDCDVQDKELGPHSWVDFQAHWSHRFLFDLDGAGFSGRFLPFLQSRSLPFRTGLFRQWFDSRIISWHHFVPVDIRLHGLWSTLAYFAGASGPKPTDQQESREPPVFMEPHLNEGWRIAEQGRGWAETALRKEDMEIYFFRLLLEWGRITDDQRDVLGFKL
ncbi:putative UDP-Xyl: (mannosyl) glucuronoxylomannan/galactoxylomannan beta-1,2-xylosyltransferase [Penicillium oxalicum 114-2]|uniref:Putative UDP-Xyl: (Mannosyl) glucuronoxylomannan/galactoxylomannan beta-1,2-xylosyltransferase n=1 Tax=Penicillium oxalicum (strain 114-2 / CGMCC 5302) TaxID=933388 RepID=S7ZBR2_PENO1|nr:putative UDP-Xyl: (mannosyl) glucuronoxylomannan/galactoxylomannan beta-1,2-xylosyltransferase [Penicillium oxalicum 114-2]